MATAWAVFIALSLCSIVPDASALKASHLRDQSGAVINKLLHKRAGGNPPTKDYVWIAYVSKNDLSRKTLDFTRKCKTANSGLQTNYPAFRPLSVTYEDMEEEVEGGDVYRMSRFKGSQGGTYSAVASPRCFAALMPEGDGSVYIPDYQVLMAAWMYHWVIPVWKYAVVYGTNQPCEYPKMPEENDPDNYCTRIPNEIFKNSWNKHGDDFSRRVLYIQYVDEEYYVVYDFAGDRQFKLPWDEEEDLDSLLNKYVQGTIPIAPCLGVTCSNGGTTYVFEATQCRCNCTDEWTGPRCEEYNCPSGFSYDVRTDICVMATAKTTDYATAAFNCHMLGIGYRLAILDTKAKREAAASDLGDGDYFIGFIQAPNEGSFFSPHTGVIIQESDAAWASGEPDDAGGDEDCVALSVASGVGSFKDVACDGPTSALCQRDMN